jgi:hypothetical protein
MPPIKRSGQAPAADGHTGLRVPAGGIASAALVLRVCQKSVRSKVHCKTFLSGPATLQRLLVFYRACAAATAKTVVRAAADNRRMESLFMVKSVWC